MMLLSVRLFIKTLFSRKIIIITIIALVTFAISVMLAVLDKYPVVAGILSNIGVSFLATSLITGFEQTKGNKASCLMKLLSVDPSRKIAVVIPQFTEGKVTPNPAQPDKNINLIETPSMSKTDCFAGSNFIALLLSHNIALPELITDDEALDIIADDKRMQLYGHFISIGLTTNKFSSAIAANNLLKNKIQFHNEKHKEPKDKKISLCEAGQWNPYTPEDLNASDLGLLLKSACVTNEGTEYDVVICGGLNATGTSLLGTFVFKKWYTDILSLRIDNIDIHKHKNFILIYKANGLPNLRFDKSALIEKDPVFKRAF